jgi:hypothetical protein
VPAVEFASRLIDTTIKEENSSLATGFHAIKHAIKHTIQLRAELEENEGGGAPLFVGRWSSNKYGENLGSIRDYENFLGAAASATCYLARPLLPMNVCSSNISSKLVLFHLIGRFAFPRCIVFAMYLNILYI